MFETLMSAKSLFAFFSFSQPAKNIAPARIAVATMGRIVFFIRMIKNLKLGNQIKTDMFSLFTHPLETLTLLEPPPGFHKGGGNHVCASALVPVS